MKKTFYKKIFSLGIIFSCVALLSIIPLSVLNTNAQTQSSTQSSGSFVGASAPETCNLGSSGATFTTFTQCIVDSIISIVVPFLFAIALVTFSIGVLNYVKNADNESKRSESLQMIIWSVIGLFFMVSVWAFSAMVANFLGVPGATSDLKIPQIKE